MSVLFKITACTFLITACGSVTHPASSEHAPLESSPEVLLRDAGQSAAQLPDSGTRDAGSADSADAGETHDSGYVPTASCTTEFGAPLGYVSVYRGASEVELVAGSAQYHIARVTVHACVRITLKNLEFNVNFNGESWQTPQEPRDPTGNFLSDGEYAFQEVYLESPALPSPVQALPYGESRDDFMVYRATFAETPVELLPGEFIWVYASVRTTPNPDMNKHPQRLVVSIMPFPDPNNCDLPGCLGLGEHVPITIIYP